MLTIDPQPVTQTRMIHHILPSNTRSHSSRPPCQMCHALCGPRYEISNKLVHNMPLHDGVQPPRSRSVRICSMVGSFLQHIITTTNL